MGDTIKTIAGGALPGFWSKADFDQNTIIHLYPAAGQPRALWIAPRQPCTPGPAARPVNLAVERGAKRCCHAHGTAGGCVCAANAQLRIGGRCELQEGLLPRQGSGGAQPVPGHTCAVTIWRTPAATSPWAAKSCADDLSSLVARWCRLRCRRKGAWMRWSLLQIAATEQPLQVAQPVAWPCSCKAPPYPLLEDI